MAKKQVLELVSLIGYLQSFLSGIASALMSLVGEGNEHVANEKLRYLSTPEGKPLLGVIAQVINRGKLCIADSIVPGSIIYLQPIVESGKPYEVTITQSGKEYPLVMKSDVVFYEKDLGVFVRNLCALFDLGYVEVTKSNANCILGSFGLDERFLREHACFVFQEKSS